MPLTALPLNTSDIPRSDLDIRDQTRTNPLPWKGQFSPQLVEALLMTYAERGARILDPFAGSGTVLGECARLGLAGTGAEINPAAVLLARLYEWTNRTQDVRRVAVDSLAAAVERVIASKHPADGDLLGPTHLRPQDVVSFARRIHSVEVRQVLEATLVLADPSWSELSAARLVEAQRRVRELVVGLPSSDAPITMLQTDARRLPIGDAHIDVVLTSPPYINVFNYHQQYRPAIEALDHDVLDAARSEIGSNRKHRMNRFLTVIQYAIDMAAVLDELKRVLRVGGRLIMVVGRESLVRGVSIPNGSLLSSVAIESAGLTPLMRQERAFRNRFGQQIVEDILHFERQGPAQPASRDSVIDIARVVLERSLPMAAGEVREDIRAAIRGSEGVKPSPTLAA